MNYIVKTRVDGILTRRQIFTSRTKAQKYILEKFNAYAKDDRFYIRFVHYSNWGKYKKPYNEMTIDTIHVQTKNISICIELLHF
jgi:predicted rRNA methylase YqxC with S4 and FtsJ domains